MLFLFSYAIFMLAVRSCEANDSFSCSFDGPTDAALLTASDSRHDGGDDTSDGVLLLQTKGGKTSTEKTKEKATHHMLHQLDGEAEANDVAETTTRAPDSAAVKAGCETHAKRLAAANVAACLESGRSADCAKSASQALASALGTQLVPGTQLGKSEAAGIRDVTKDDAVSPRVLTREAHEQNAEDPESVAALSKKHSEAVAKGKTDEAKAIKIKIKEALAKKRKSSTQGGLGAGSLGRQGFSRGASNDFERLRASARGALTREVSSDMAARLAAASQKDSSNAADMGAA